MCRCLSRVPEHQGILPNPAYQQETENKPKLITKEAPLLGWGNYSHSPQIFGATYCNPCSRDLEFSAHGFSPCEANAPTQAAHADHELVPGTAAIYTRGVQTSYGTWQFSHPHCQVAAEVKGNQDFFRPASSDLFAEE